MHAPTAPPQELTDYQSRKYLHLKSKRTYVVVMKCLKFFDAT